MNVLHLISSKGLFGAENVMLQLCGQLLKRRDMEPIAGVIENIKTPHVEVATACREMNISTTRFVCRNKADFKTLVALRQFIRKNNIAIVHSHGYKSNIYAYFATRYLSTRLVATCHNWICSSTKMKMYAMLDRFFLGRFDHVITVSEDVAKKLLKAGIKNSKVSMINNGVSCNRHQRSGHDKLRKTIGIPEDAVVVGCVGRISPEKGHQHLLRVTSEIVQRYPEVYFLIIGDGDLKIDLEREYASSHVIFTGFRNDVSRYYACMDIFVLPSLTEGMPMVLLEAMSWALPVVATKVGAIPAILEDTCSGILAKPGSRTDLKNALSYLLENPIESKEMGIRAYRTVESRYSAEKMATEYIKIYKKIVKKGRSNG